MLRRVLTTGETVTDDDFTAIDPTASDGTGSRRGTRRGTKPARSSVSPSSSATSPIAAGPRSSCG
jgi:hypothetical protein